MAHDLFKLGVTLIVLAIVIIVMALFVSGYLSAFKHGGKNQTPSIPAGIAGGKGGRAAVASPTPGPGPAHNVSMARGGYPQNARYPPSGPMIPAAPPAPPAWGMSPGGTRPPVPSPRASPSPQPSAAPAPPSPPSGEGPAMANSPYTTVWEFFIDQIIRMLAAAVPAQNNIFPAWPQSGFHS